MKKKYIHLIPPALTLVVMLLVFIIKGVYPFGNSDIAYYDMIAHYVPNYSRNYEILHGNESFTFDWLVGAGCDMTASYSGFTLFPLNWVFFFVRPEYVLRFLSLFLTIKLMLTSVSISVYLKKTYDTSDLIHIALCMIYTVSGYVMQQYMNLFFLDSMMMFPLIVLSMRHLHDTGKGLPYLLMLSLQMLSTWYLGFMTLLYLLFYSFGLLFLTPKEKRPRFAAGVGIFTFASISISAVTTMPSLISTLTSTRVVDYSFSPLLIFKFGNPEPQFLAQKIFTIFNTELAAAFALILLFRRFVRKEKLTGETAFRLCMMLLMLIPVFNEAIHLIWHGGSYAHFPYRCGYIYIFAATEVIAHLWGKTTPVRNSITDKKPMSKVLAPAAAAVLLISGTVLFVIMGLTFVDCGIYVKHGIYTYFPIIFILCTAAYILLILFCGKKAGEYTFTAVSILHAAIAAVCFIAPMDLGGTMSYITRKPSYEDNIELREQAMLDKDSLSRIKMFDPALSRNYSMLLGTPSLTQWMTDTAPEFKKKMTEFGYCSEYVVNYDWGGTLFSDALLNVKKTAALKDTQLPEQVYTKYSETDTFTVYDINYTIPFGLLEDDRLLSLDTDQSKITMSDITAYTSDTSDEDSSLPEESTERYIPDFSAQIQTASVLLGDDSMFTEISPDTAESIDPVDPDHKKSFRYNIHIETPSVLYASLAEYSSVTVNGQKIGKNVYVQDDTYSFEDPGYTQAGYFDAGEDVEIIVSNRTGTTTNDLFVLLDLDAMQALCDRYNSSCASSYKAGKNRLDITADVKDGRNYMFLPLEYLSGWSAEANGTPVKIHPVMNGTFMALELPDGHCEITMRFKNPLIGKGIMVSVFGIITAAVILLFKKRGKDITAVPFVGKTAYVLLNTAAVSAIAVIYVLPLLI